ncbi:sugar ABC transporter substrate-binding protein [Saxibacter everestensis]|uniref:Sugar ABC transporter substrate-binding protein n=1 Tax=Saxibacter everestensis TaxID=2909229 RepID=A0ABY8QX79_9MICO|nr:sugar ABC transporter substrate-binding protein [Brevibacteriaceae bacterium ZFBP1038]
MSIPASFSRRSALKLGVATGSVFAVSSLLAACSDPSEGGGSAANTDSWTKANMDWKQQAGATLVFGASTHQWITALQPHLPTFESLTGIKVRLDVAGEEQFNTKLPVDLNSGSPTPDIFMVPSYGQAVGAKWLEPLDDFLSNTKLTDEKWFDDTEIFQSARDFVTWKDGTRYGMPITAEVQTTIYRSDLLKSAPKTFDELETVVARLKSEGKVDAGIALRGKPTAGAIAWPAAGYVFSYGGYLIDPDGKAALDSPETVAAVQRYADVLKAGGPAGVSSWDWLEINTAMQQGRAGMMQDSTNAIPDLRNPDKSTIADKFAVGAFPSQDGRSSPNLWHWIVGLNSKGKNKDAAWLFLQWATSKPTSILLSTNGATPPRTSAWENPSFAEGFGKEAAETVLGQLKAVDSKPMVAAWMHPKWPQVGDAFARAANTAVTSGTSAKDALADAQKAAAQALG